MQVEMSRSEFRRQIYSLIRRGHGRGLRAFLLRWEAFRRPFFKNELKFSPAVLYSNSLWLKPRGQSEFDFLVELLRFMGEGAEDLRYLYELNRVEEQRYAQAQIALMGIFQSVRLVKPVEAVARAYSASRGYVLVD